MNITKPPTAKERVLRSLLHNLEHLSSFEDWVPEHPLVVEYVEAMDEPHREYHNWNHIDHMLGAMSELPFGMISDPERFRAAIIFLDVVCKPDLSDNEFRSTLFASKFYRNTTIALVSDLILATEHRFPFEHFRDDRDVLCDLDLEILGADPVRFDLYRIGIQQEYRGYCTREEFELRTQKFFGRLKEQYELDSIYRTERFRKLYEEQARENIDRMLNS